MKITKVCTGRARLYWVSTWDGCTVSNAHLSAMIHFTFIRAMPPETLDANLCSTYSTSDKKMRLHHNALAVTGKAVVARSYGPPEGSRCVWLGLWWIDRKQEKKAGGGRVGMTLWHIWPTSQCELCLVVMSKGSCMWARLYSDMLKLCCQSHKQRLSLTTLIPDLKLFLTYFNISLLFTLHLFIT